MDLNSARIFALVAAKGSFSAASRHSGIPIATVSRRVAELEASLNLNLLERSTRKLRLTEAGATFYDYVSRGIEEMDAGLLAIREQEKDLRGRLRFSMPPCFEPMWDLIDAFQEKHQNIEVDVFISERRLDFIADGIDIALRVGDVASQSAVARQLTTYRHQLVASPHFLANSPIQNPQDLLKVNCVAWSAKEDNVEWILGDEKIRIHPFLQANDYWHLRHLALRHRCVTELPPFLCKTAIASGELIAILAEHPLPQQQVNLVYPSRKSVSRTTRVFIDFCVANFPV